MIDQPNLSALLLALLVTASASAASVPKGAACALQASGESIELKRERCEFPEGNPVDCAFLIGRNDADAKAGLAPTQSTDVFRADASPGAWCAGLREIRVGPDKSGDKPVPAREIHSSPSGRLHGYVICLSPRKPKLLLRDDSGKSVTCDFPF